MITVRDRVVGVIGCTVGNVIEQGGWLVFDNGDVEVVEPPPEDIDFDAPEARWRVYRFGVESCDPKHEWFAGDVEGDPSDFSSTDVMVRARAYWPIVESNDIEEFDCDPLELRLWEIEERYCEIGDITPGGETSLRRPTKPMGVLPFEHPIYAPQAAAGATGRGHDVRMGDLIVVGEYGTVGNDPKPIRLDRAFARVLGIAWYDGLKRAQQGRYLVVLQANPTLRHGYIRFVSLDHVEYVVSRDESKSPFTLFFLFGTLPDAATIIEMDRYGSLNNEYLGRSLDESARAVSPYWKERQDWKTLHESASDTPDEEPPP